MEKRVLDITESAAYLVALGFDAVTAWTVRGLIATGEVRATKMARRCYVSIDDLNAYVDRAFGPKRTGQYRGGHGLAPVKRVNSSG